MEIKALVRVRTVRSLGVGKSLGVKNSPVIVQAINKSAIDVYSKNLCIHIFTTESKGKKTKNAIRVLQKWRMKMKEAVFLKLDRRMEKLRQAVAVEIANLFR